MIRLGILLYLLFVVSGIYCSDVAVSAAPRCKNLLQAKRKIQRINSTTFPDNFHDVFVCEYTIKAKKGMYIKLAFKHLELDEYSPWKLQDYIEVINLNDSSVIRLYKGPQYTPFDLIARTNQLLLRYTRYLRGWGKGFFLTYRAVKNWRCGGIDLNVLYGKTSCRDNPTTGLPRACTITCRRKHALVGKKRIECNDTGNFKPPTCVNKDFSLCAKNTSNPKCRHSISTVARYFMTHKDEYADDGPQIPEGLVREAKSFLPPGVVNI